jgi:hypothetical protein
MYDKHAIIQLARVERDSHTVALTPARDLVRFATTWSRGRLPRRGRFRVALPFFPLAVAKFFDWAKMC